MRRIRSGATSRLRMHSSVLLPHVLSGSPQWACPQRARNMVVSGTLTCRTKGQSSPLRGSPQAERPQRARRYSVTVMTYPDVATACMSASIDRPPEPVSFVTTARRRRAIVPISPMAQSSGRPSACSQSVSSEPAVAGNAFLRSESAAVSLASYDFASPLNTRACTEPGGCFHALPWGNNRPRARA